MEKKAMKRVNVILETELYDKARVVGFIRKKSLSEIVRDALRDWLRTNVDERAELVLSEKDERGEKYDGAAHKYVIHFDKGGLPPVKGFWSLTMYDPEFFFVPNPINRYNLSQRNTFVTNPDGSVDLYLQAESPGPDKEANWLPAPKGKFIPMLRLYWPTDTPPSILDGSWKPPALKRVP